MPEATPFFGRHVVVHYVTEGADAPDLRDADGDRVPDYVVEIGNAADAALDFYRAPEFGGMQLSAYTPPLCDAGGPNEWPDIYVKDIPGSGLAIQATQGEGGSFVFLDPHLENEAVSGGTAFSAAHEMFHLVQFSYVPSGMPAWVGEGTANLFAFLWQRIDNPLLLASIDRWVRTPSVSLFAEEVSGCDRCYGGIYWWGAATVVGNQPVLARYFELLRAQSESGASVGNGLEPLQQAFREFYVQRGLTPIATEALYFEFNAISEAIFFVLAPRRPPFLYHLRPNTRVRRVTRRLEPLSTHYVRLTLGSKTRALRLKVRSTGAVPQMSVFLGISGDHCSKDIIPKFTVVGQSAILGDEIVAPVSAALVRRATALMITSASLQPVTYTLEYRAFNSPRPLLGNDLGTCAVSESQESERDSVRKQLEDKS